MLDMLPTQAQDCIQGFEATSRGTPAVGFGDDYWVSHPDFRCMEGLSTVYGTTRSRQIYRETGPWDRTSACAVPSAPKAPRKLGDLRHVPISSRSERRDVQRFARRNSWSRSLACWMSELKSSIYRSSTARSSPLRSASSIFVRIRPPSWRWVRIYIWICSRK